MKTQVEWFAIAKREGFDPIEITANTKEELDNKMARHGYIPVVGVQYYVFIGGQYKSIAQYNCRVVGMTAPISKDMRCSSESS